MWLLEKRMCWKNHHRWPPKTTVWLTNYYHCNIIASASYEMLKVFCSLRELWTVLSMATEERRSRFSAVFVKALQSVVKVCDWTVTNGVHALILKAAWTPSNHCLGQCSLDGVHNNRNKKLSYRRETARQLHMTTLSLIHIWRCRRSYACRSRWSPYH